MFLVMPGIIRDLSQGLQNWPLRTSDTGQLNEKRPLLLAMSALKLWMSALAKRANRGDWSLGDSQDRLAPVFVPLHRAAGGALQISRAKQPKSC